MDGTRPRLQKYEHPQWSRQTPAAASKTVGCSPITKAFSTAAPCKSSKHRAYRWQCGGRTSSKWARVMHGTGSASSSSILSGSSACRFSRSMSFSMFSLRTGHFCQRKVQTRCTSLPLWHLLATAKVKPWHSIGIARTS